MDCWKSNTNRKWILTVRSKSVCVCFFSYAFSIIELIMSCDTMAATGYSSNFFHTYFFGFYCYIRGKCDIILKIFRLNSAFYLDFCYIYDFKSQSFVCLSVGRKILWKDQLKCLFQIISQCFKLIAMTIFIILFFAESNGYDIIPYSWKQKFSR